MAAAYAVGRGRKGPAGSRAGGEGGAALCRGGEMEKLF